MEYKIGEIFEYNGEWYQCLKSASCDECAFLNSNCIDTPNIKCSADDRKDHYSVIFKRLEKVGEPYMAHDPSRNKDVVVQDYKLYNQHACYNGHEETLVFGLYGRDGMVTIKSKEPIKKLNCENSVEIEIKQNKEDMEATISNDATKHSNSENIGKNLKTFSLEAAKSGKPVCTRDGRPARVICFDRVGKLPIVALVENSGKEDVYFYLNCGKDNEDEEKEYDLMMLPEKKEGWINIYPNELKIKSCLAVSGDKVYPTKELAEYHALHDCIATVPVEWEE